MEPEDVLKGYVDEILMREGWSRMEVSPIPYDELSGMDSSELRTVLDANGRNNEYLKVLLHRIANILEFGQDLFLPEDGEPDDGWFLIPNGFMGGLQPFMDLEAGRTIVSDARDILLSRRDYALDPDEAIIMERESRLSLAYRFEFEHGDFFRGRRTLVVDAMEGTVETSMWGQGQSTADPVLAKDLVDRLHSIYMADWLDDYRGSPIGHMTIKKWSEPIGESTMFDAVDGYGWSLTVFSEGFQEPLRFMGYKDVPYNYHQLVDILGDDLTIMDVHLSC